MTSRLEYAIHVSDEFCTNKHLRAPHPFWRVGVIDVDFARRIHRHPSRVKSVTRHATHEREICVHARPKGFHPRHCDSVSTHFHTDPLDFGILFRLARDPVTVTATHFDAHIRIAGDVRRPFRLVFANYSHIWRPINSFHGFIGDLFPSRERYVSHVRLDFFNFPRRVLRS